LFDLLYDKLVENLPLIAQELKDTNEITQRTMEGLLETAFEQASGRAGRVLEGSRPEEHPQFFVWLENVISRRDVEQLMRQVS
ncbi:MAG: hypothetical protein GWO16_00365, partial [Gammaproteobacteria bacterium]|nr:hypothetical protein [Gammaproteobacteria bacterium]